MVVTATNWGSLSIFSRFLYSQASLKTDNIFANVPNSVLHIKGIMIKNKNSLYALFVNIFNSIVILGEVDLQTYSFVLKQTLGAIYNYAITRSIFINENLYYVGIEDYYYNTFFTTPDRFTFPVGRGIIMSSDVSSASYALDDSGINIQFDLKDFTPN